MGHELAGALDRRFDVRRSKGSLLPGQRGEVGGTVALPLSTAARSGFAVCALVTVAAREIPQKMATSIGAQTPNIRSLITIPPFPAAAWCKHCTTHTRSRVG